MAAKGRRSPSPGYWRDRRWNGPNQPVVGVSFWEAEACCAWAGEVFAAKPLPLTPLFRFRSSCPVGRMNAVDREELIGLLAEALMRDTVFLPRGRHWAADADRRRIEARTCATGLVDHLCRCGIRWERLPPAQPHRTFSDGPLCRRHRPATSSHQLPVSLGLLGWRLSIAR